MLTWRKFVFRGGFWNYSCTFRNKKELLWNSWSYPGDLKMTTFASVRRREKGTCSKFKIWIWDHLQVFHWIIDHIVSPEVEDFKAVLFCDHRLFSQLACAPCTIEADLATSYLNWTQSKVRAIITFLWLHTGLCSLFGRLKDIARNMCWSCVS